MLRKSGQGAQPLQCVPLFQCSEFGPSTRTGQLRAAYESRSMRTGHLLQLPWSTYTHIETHRYRQTDGRIRPLLPAVSHGPNLRHTTQWCAHLCRHTWALLQMTPEGTLGPTSHYPFPWPGNFLSYQNN